MAPSRRSVDQPGSIGRLSRVDPLSLPSTTDSRFALLVASVVGASLFLANLLYFQVPVLAGGVRDVYAACWDSQRPTVAATLDASAFASCTGSADRAQAVWVLGGVGLVILLAGAVFVSLPRLLRRQRQLVLVDPEEIPDVVAALHGLCREAGLARSPAFVWNPLDQSVGGQAFGYRGAYAVALSGGLVRQFYRQRPVFRGVVLHELAHIHNGDVDKTYFALALASAFVLVALVPFALSIALPWTSPDPGRFAVHLYNTGRVVGLVALVAITLASILRSRELYADLRASSWDGAGDGLARALGSLPEPAGTGWRNLLHVHPTRAERWAAVTATAAPPRLTRMEAFGAGLVATLALPSVSALVQLVTHDPTWTLLVPAIVFCAPVVGSVGLDVWGLVLVDESVRPARAPLRGVPLSLAAGALVGQAVAFDPALQLVDLPDAGTWLGLAILGLVSTGLLLLSLRWIVRYLGAAAVVARHAARTSGTASRPLMVLGLGVGAGLFALWLALVLVAHLELVLILMQHPAADWLLLVLFAVASVWTIAAQPLTLMVLLGLCAMGVARARVANRARRQSADAA